MKYKDIAQKEDERMPPKQKITKEMILKTGYEMVRDKGIESVNSRTVSAMLQCSTQPVFSQFPTMEELRAAIHRYACEQFEQYVLADRESREFLKKSYLKVIQLARTEPNLFQLIYLSKYCKGEDLFKVRMGYESNQRIFKEIQENYQLDTKAAQDILGRMSIFIHGIAALICTSNISYTDDEVIIMAEQTLQDMVHGWSVR